MRDIKRGVVRSYDSAAHKAVVQIAGSLAVWLDAVRVATNIPPADVVPGRQCAVLFLDPSNQDDAVVISVQGALPSVGEILQARATADLTLTTTPQSITGDGDSNKVRLILPSPGDWLVTAVCDFGVDATDPDALIGELFVSDSGSPESGRAVLWPEHTDRATVAQEWKVTTTAADTPVELKAHKLTGAGTAKARAPHTHIVASGVKRSTGGGGGVTDHGALTGLGDHDHAIYGRLAQAETWAALQTYAAGIRLAAGQAVQDSGGIARYKPATSSPHNTLTGDTKLDGWTAVKSTPAANKYLNISPPTQTITASTNFLEINPSANTLAANNINVYAVYGAPAFYIGDGNTGIQLSGLNFAAVAAFGNASSALTRLAGSQVTYGLVMFTGAVTEANGLLVNTPYVTGGAPTVPTAIGVRIQNQGFAGVTNAYGLKIDQQAAATNNYLIWAERTPGNPSLRLDSGNPPNAALATEGDSQLYLAWMENGVVNLRQVRWRQQSSLSAGDRVLIV